MNRFIKGVVMEQKDIRLSGETKKPSIREAITKLLSDRKKRNRLIWISIATLAAAAAVIFCSVYLSECYRADGEAIEAYIGKEDISVYSMRDGVSVFAPMNAEAGLIFYPGGKVECDAYVPLMVALAERGILCVLVEMPFNLAVFGVNRADGITDSISYIDNWYIGGHSLGGSMAGSYLSKNADAFDGLVLLGSYSTADVKSERVLSVFGSEDTVMNSEKYERYRSNLPADLTEYIIDGGCHAYFGMYGEQEGDGKASITPAEQIAITAEIIADFMFTQSD